MDALDHVDFSHAPADTFFLEQTSHRKKVKRRKKLIEDLPDDLRSPHGRFMLAHRNREDKDDSLDDSLLTSRSSLLPQIHDTFNLIRNSLNTNLLNDEHSQQYIFQETKRHSIDVLTLLAKYLYIPRSRVVNLPRKLELTLNANYDVLTSDVQVMPREWPSAVREDLFGTKTMENDSKDSVSAKSHGDDDSKSVISFKMTAPTPSSAAAADNASSASSKPKIGKVNPLAALLKKAPGPQLTDIAEGKDESSQAHSSNDNGAAKSNQPAPETPAKGLCKAKLLWNKVEQFKKKEAETRAMGGKVTKGKIVGAFLETLSQGTKMSYQEKSFFTTINFQLSSQDCDDKGWIVHPEKSKDKAMSDLALHKAGQQLKEAIKTRKKEEHNAKLLGHDRPPILKYYGDGRREMRRQQVTQSAPAGLRGKIEMPKEEDPSQSGRKLFLAAIPDGTTTIFYKSGRPAVISTAAGIGVPGFCTIMYDDDAEKTMLGCFSAGGQGCCYHSNGLVNLLVTETGGTIADEYGVITRRWNWPPGQGAKLALCVQKQLNANMQVKCLGKSNITLYFMSQKETAKVSLGTPLIADAHKAKHMQNLIQPNIAYTPHGTKDLPKTKQAKSLEVSKDKKSKSNKKEKKNPLLQNPELQKLIDFPEATLNDADADKDLLRLQRKAKNAADDWLEHYRIYVGLKSPHLRSMKESPHYDKGKRNIQSAKSSPGSIRVILESMNLQIPRHTVSQRAPSAPSGRTAHIESHERNEMEPPSLSSHRVKRDVTFQSTNTLDVEPSEVLSTGRSSPFLAAQGAGPTRSMSAPERRKSSAPARPASPYKPPNQRTCPVALHAQILGDPKATCRCVRHKVPCIMDLEFDALVFSLLPDEQLIVIAVFSSAFTSATNSLKMIGKLFAETNKNRSRPCLQSSQDEMRIFVYDTATAAKDTDHIQPLLLRRHNVIPGMFLMYKGGRLLFCDHIFNGYGNERRDFLKQISMAQDIYARHLYLPDDFRFSPQKGQAGKRAPWGGEIGGAGADDRPHGKHSKKREATKSSISGGTSSGYMDMHLNPEFDEPLTKLLHLELAETSSNYVSGSLHDYSSTSRTSHGFSFLALPSVSESFRGSIAPSTVFA